MENGNLVVKDDKEMFENGSYLVITQQVGKIYKNI
jgi:hypothetical protein